MPLLCCAPSRRLLLGKQSGRTVEVCNSFELKYTAGEGGAGVAVEQTFMEERTRQYKDVFKNLEVVGWYSTGGAAPREGDEGLHTGIFQTLNESPVFLLLDAAVDPSKRTLPVKLYEAEMRVGPGGGEPVAALVECTYSIQTEEAERIAVDQATKVSAAGETAATQLTQHLDGMRRAVKMLHGRVAALADLVRRMDAGEVPMVRARARCAFANCNDTCDLCQRRMLTHAAPRACAQDHSLVRRVAALARRLPALDTPDFRRDFLREQNDGLLTIYLANVTRGVADTANLVDKLNVLSHDRSARMHHARGGRGGRYGGMGLRSTRDRADRKDRGAMRLEAD